MEERLGYSQNVVGSNPSPRTMKTLEELFQERLLAELLKTEEGKEMLAKAMWPNNQTPPTKSK